MVHEESGITGNRLRTKGSVCATLAEEVNAAQTINEKAAKAKELMEVAEELLACEEYEEGGLECQCCRGLSLLRKKTTALILKMASLGG